MSKKKQKEEIQEEIPVTTKKYIYVAIGCAAAGAVFYALMFTVISIYGLIAGIVFEICAIGFAKTQKSKNPVSYGKIVTVVSYVLLGIGIAIMVAGTIYSAVVSG